MYAIGEKSNKFLLCVIYGMREALNTLSAFAFLFFCSKGLFCTHRKILILVNFDHNLFVSRQLQLNITISSFCSENPFISMF